MEIETKKDFLFSIIVPVYNTEKYIEKCLNSIKEAIDVDCEVIIVNDGSTDNSENIIIDFINKLTNCFKDNFVYIKKENKGLADTKNVGIENARGKYISVVDSDDYISNDFYTIGRKYTDNYDVIIYDLYIVFEKNNKWNYTSRAYRDDKEKILEAFLNGAMSGSSCNKIIKKELYNNNKFPVGKQYEDTAVTPFILVDAQNIKYIPYPLYYYLQREKSIVATNTLMSAFYKICSNISEVLEIKERSFEKYKYIINEFFVDRFLDIIVQDYNENKKEFINNLKEFYSNNTNVINYILESNMIFECENHYSDRQKNIVRDMIVLISNNNYKKVKQLLFKRKIVNYIRTLKGSFINFLKSIVNK